MDGICTLGNDVVYDQLVALLNSIEAIQGPEVPVCVYPYNDNTEKIKTEIAKRPNVELYSDRQSMEKWDKFVRDVWDTHPTARQRWSEVGSRSYHRIGTHRRYAAFDGPFERFIYMDADTILMSPLDRIFQQLNQNDWVIYDFQYKDLTHVYDVSSAKMKKLFTSERLASEVFCSGFYGSKKDIFDAEKRDWLLSKFQDGEAEVLYPMAPDQTILNYMVMRLNLKVDNLAISLSPNEITGNSVTSKHFEEQDHIVYDRGKRLTYLHYIGVSSKAFAKICAGKNIDIPYRDIFLHYRYLHEPEKRPVFTTKPKPYETTPNLFQRVLKKLKFTHK